MMEYIGLAMLKIGYVLFQHVKLMQARSSKCCHHSKPHLGGSGLQGAVVTWTGQPRVEKQRALTLLRCITAWRAVACRPRSNAVTRYADEQEESSSEELG
jgi:hypothetical protein